MIRLTFRLNPFILDAMLLPVAWRVIFRIVLSVGQVDDDSKIRDGFNNIDGCVPEEKENKVAYTETNDESLNTFYLSSDGRHSEMCWKERKDKWREMRN